LFLGIIEYEIELFSRLPTEMLESGEGVLEEKFFCVPFGFGEKVSDGLSGTSIAEEFGHFGKTFSSGERGDGDDGSPEVGEVAAADEFSDAFEKPLAEGGKAVYIDHWTSPVDPIFLRKVFANES
jgi:hypothetical protein